MIITIFLLKLDFFSRGVVVKKELVLTLQNLDAKLKFLVQGKKYVLSLHLVSSIK